MNSENKIMKIKKLFLNKKNIYSILLIVIIFALDRFSKNEIINMYSENTYYVNEFLNFNLIWNTGIGFGLFSSDSSLIYNLVTAIITFVILILFYVVIISGNLDKLIYSIIIGGALGNFYDRLNYNAVPDFIDLNYNGYHWFTFNVADIFITIGIMMLLVKSIFENN